MEEAVKRRGDLEAKLAGFVQSNSKLESEKADLHEKVHLLKKKKKYYKGEFKAKEEEIEGLKKTHDQQLN